MSKSALIFVYAADRRSEVEAGDLRRVLRFVDSLERAGRKARGSLALTFDGYDDTPEEIYEIPEIRRWVAGLLKRKPHLPYFLTFEKQNVLFILACCSDVRATVPMAARSSDLSPFERLGVPLLIEIRMPPRLFKRMDWALRAYCKKVGDPEYYWEFWRQWSEINLLD
jgi:hypothetical protein